MCKPPLIAGFNVDEFGKRLSFFFNVHNNFFEEIAKFRAAGGCGPDHERALWRQRPECDEVALPLASRRFHLTAQQPENNIVRVAIQALASVLGGTQSLHTNSMDEAWAYRPKKPPPSPCAHSRSLRLKRVRPT